MWLSEKLTALLSLNVEETRRLREDLAVVRAERDALKLQNAITQNNFDWAKGRVNTLELEKAALLQKAFNINIPVPEIVRTDRTTSTLNIHDLFEGPPLSAYDELDEIA